jgi:3-oxoacyl-[acyl-carrier-protein] synthase-1
MWVTGTGVVCSTGAHVNALWQAAQENCSFIEEGLGKIEDAKLVAFQTHPSLSFFQSQLQFLAQGLPDTKPLYLTLYALSQAITAAGWTEFRDDDGIILATTTGQISTWDKALVQYLHQKIDAESFKKKFRNQPLGTLLEAVCQTTQFPGKRMVIASACSASTQAIGLAHLWLKQGKVKRCIVGGVEVLCDLTIQGFKSLQLMDSDPCRPFDQNRRGINLSEGAAFLCLEANPSLKDPLAKVSGYGFSTDGYHMTAPHPEGRGSLCAMKSALNCARLSTDDISWVHAHGTGSRHNDESEGKAIHQLFGQNQPWVSSSKGIHGHSLGASGALEAVLCIQSLQHQVILKTMGLQVPDVKISIRHPEQNFSTEVKHILKNTLGFGGVNASLVLSRPDLGGP